jgi:intracellular septation protein A
MRKVWAAARSNAADFGGLIVFYLLLWLVGLKAAIAGLLVFVAIDVVRRFRQRLGFPRIYVLSNALAVVFGGVDLVSANPFMIKYEAVLTSLFLGALLLMGVRGKSFLQEMVEQQRGETFDDQPEVVQFFKALTLAWGGYFIVKAAAYLWLGEMLPMERLLAIRPIVGMLSLAAMMALSWQGARLLGLLRRLRLVPSPAPRSVAAPGSASAP